MIGAEIMVKCLEAEGTKMLFGYPGVAIVPFFEAASHSESIKQVLIRTEQNAAHAASGYARSTGKPAVCVATSGPGATNLLTGIATAHADSIPLICITGQVRSELIGSDVFQEADVTGAAESFVKYSYLVKDAKELPRIMKEAFHIASTGRPGPVLIDVPIDIQQAEVGEFVYPEKVNLRTYKPTVKGHSVQIKKVLKEIIKAKQPLILAGGGVRLSGAQKELLELAERYNLPVVTTMMGKDNIATDHPLNFGMVGNNGHPYAKKALSEADMILVIGCRFADRAIQHPTKLVKDTVVAHIDVDPAEIGKNAIPTIPLVGDIRNILKDMLKVETVFVNREGWLDQLRFYKQTMDYKRNPNKDFVDPEGFIVKMTEKMDDNSVYVADVGQNQIWSCRYAVVKSGRFMTSGGMGTMGYSIPAAMGAKAANPKQQVVAVCGDGSFQMSMMELATIVQHKIPVKIVVFNNHVLGMVREYEHYVYADNYAMIDLSGSPDFGKLASAYGIGYVKADNMEGIEEKIDAFLAEEGPVLMECAVDPYDLVN